MKKLSLLLLSLLPVGSLLLAQTNAGSPYQGELIMLIDGYEVDREALSHEIFCLSNLDTLQLQYKPVGTEGEYVIFGAELWAQVALGEPTMLVQIPAGEPAASPTLALPLGIIPPHYLPNDDKAVRVMVIVRRVLKVDGRRYLGHMDVPSAEPDFTFLMTKSCE